MATPRRLVLAPRAEDDLRSIGSYLAEHASEATAIAQLRKFETACESLADHPFRGRPRDKLAVGLRSILLNPYVVFYRVTDPMVEIIRVLHGKRDLDTAFSDPDDRG